MSHDLLAELCPPPAEEALRPSSQSPSVASSSPARTSLFSHSSALSDSQITALDVLEQQAAAGVGSSIAATLKTGFKHVSAWLPASWASDAVEESPEAAAVASARVLKIQQTGKEECCVIVADSQQLQLWEVLVSTGMPLLKTTVEEKSCVDALICGSNGRFVAIVGEVLEDPEAHDLKLADSTTGRILAAQRLPKLAVGLQYMAGFLLVQHAVGVSVYRLEQLEFVRHINTASSAISTSNRWLAFEGPPSKSSSSSASQQQQQDDSPSKATYDVGDTARTVVAGIVVLSKAAHKHLSPMLKSGAWDANSSAGGGAAGGQTRSRSNSEGTKTPIKAPVGWVGIYHVRTDARSNSGNVSDTSSEQYDEAQPQAFELQRLANFQASSEPIAAMQFSPSGTKLACAPVTGQVILVFNLVKPQREVVYEASKWLEQSKRLRVDLAFKLVRGYTPSRVLSLQFSTREDRLCAVSSRGTVHVFEMPKPKRPESSSSSSGSGATSSTLPAGAMSVDKLLSAIPSSSTVPEQQALFRIKVPRRQAAQSRTPSTDDDPSAAAAAAAAAAMMSATDVRRSSHPGAGPSTLPAVGDAAATELAPHESTGKVRGAAGFLGQNALLVGTTQSLLSMHSFTECATDSPLAVWNSSVEAFYAATGQKSTPHKEALQLVAREIARWDLEALVPLSTKPATAATTSKPVRAAPGARFNWLQYVTDETSQPPLVPLWLRPPVSFFVSSTSDQAGSRLHPVFATPRANQPVTVRRLGPIPMQPSSDEPVRASPPQLTSVLGTSPLYGTLRGAALPSTMLQDTISKAMGTELRPDKRLLPAASEDSRLYDGNSLTYTSDDYFRPDAEPQPEQDAWNNPDLAELEGIFQFDDQRPSEDQPQAPLLDLSMLLSSIPPQDPTPRHEDPVDDTPLPLDAFMDMALEDINKVDKLSYQLSTSSSPDSVKDTPPIVPEPRPLKAKRRAGRR